MFKFMKTGRYSFLSVINRGVFGVVKCAVL